MPKKTIEPQVEVKQEETQAVDPVIVPEVEVVANENTELSQEAVLEEEKTVTLTAADPSKQLEVSIGVNHWKGNSIQVPASLEGDIRRILEEGGFFLRN